MKKIVVIGSSNTDLVVKSTVIPSPGETVTGGDFLMTEGGKGANQAMAVARLGGSLQFVTCLGDDLFGHNTLQHFKANSIDTQYVFTCPDAPSGVALIMVDNKGENCITVAPGANNRLGTEHVNAVRQVIEQAEYLLMQMETPMDVVTYAAQIASTSGTRVILNPAPFRTLSAELLKELFLITPNQTEARGLTGIEVTDEPSAISAAQKLIEMGVPNVVITMGSHGSLVAEAHSGVGLGVGSGLSLDCGLGTSSGLGSGTSLDLGSGTSSGSYSYVFVPAQKVQAIDTTGAGDTFNGALCVGLSEGMSLVDAVKFATKAAAIAVTRMGAQASIPRREEVR